jgi:gluconokinase
MIILLMGVSGSGKTTIGQLLADTLHWEFSDADTFHSLENIEKMRRGIPLTDADRTPWLQDLQTAIKEWLQDDRNVVLACSALKASYREFLVVNSSIKLIYLNGTFELIQQRLQKRQSHFMNEQLLKSPFDALETPSDAMNLDILDPPTIIVQKLKKIVEI